MRKEALTDGSYCLGEEKTSFTSVTNGSFSTRAISVGLSHLTSNELFHLLFPTTETPLVATASIYFWETGRSVESTAMRWRRRRSSARGDKKASGQSVEKPVPALSRSTTLYRKHLPPGNADRWECSPWAETMRTERLKTKESNSLFIREGYFYK